jgi:lipopolysaccharide transport system ATP-binding protein
MNDLIINIENLSKVYRLYTKPLDRFLDMFGFLPRKTGRYTEHAALTGINLTVKRGEKLAIIGRNGAGKSTLLKLITRVIEPTTGSIEVSGETQALLQIGTGFHPEFTGRENVRSYLANLGVAGDQAEERIAEICDFAELADYIDQPLKTYSTGMGMRLMFAASTALKPSILVIDEVLSVGDAYFTKKSLERIKDLCRDGTTLLLVTHDLYAASGLCERVVWIDQGRILLDSDPVTAIKRYESSIRDQQETRLRKLRIETLEKNLESSNNRTELVYGQLLSSGNAPIDADLPVASLSFSVNDHEITKFSTERDADGWTLITDLTESDWGPPIMVDGRPCRAFQRWGSIYHRAAFLIEHQDSLSALLTGQLRITIEYLDTTQMPVWLELFEPDRLTRHRAPLSTQGTGQWCTDILAPQRTTEVAPPVGSFNRYGTQQFSFTDVRFLDSGGKERHRYQLGETMTISLGYRINDPHFDQRPVIQLNFLKNGVTRSHRYTLENIRFDAANECEGIIEIVAEPLLLAPGDYTVNVVAMSEGGYAGAVSFYTVNPKILDHHSRAYSISIEQSNNLLVDDVVFLHPVTWRKNGKLVASGTYPISLKSV